MIGQNSSNNVLERINLNKYYIKLCHPLYRDEFDFFDDDE